VTEPPDLRTIDWWHREATVAAIARRYQADPDLDRLRARATQYVGGVGSLYPLVMFVGEAPGADEDREGKPFVGRSGQYLDRALAKRGIDRLRRCWTTNVVRYRPLKNADPGQFELAVSTPYLISEIATLEPPLVVTLGRFSMGALWSTAGRITEVHGEPREFWQGRVHLPVVHPSFAVRSRENTEMFEHDMTVLADLLRGVL
jgi:uracil-DNA glycosylase family 4